MLTLSVQVKICGITQPEQGRAIALMGANQLGFICVPQSPRYVTPAKILEIRSVLPADVERVGVFVNAAIADITAVAEDADLTTVQLHGEESLEFCQKLRAQAPHLHVTKAIRVRSPEALILAADYSTEVDALLLDAYHPTQHGGTGQVLDWAGLQEFRPGVPWFLAGGLNPENVRSAIALARPDGIDLSSGVEVAPGDKDLKKVRQLFRSLAGS